MDITMDIKINYSKYFGYLLLDLFTIRSIYYGYYYLLISIISIPITPMDIIDTILLIYYYIYYGYMDITIFTLNRSMIKHLALGASSTRDDVARGLRFCVSLTAKVIRMVI